MKSLRPDPNEFLTCEDAARELGVSRVAVQRGINAGRIPGVRVGRIFRIPVAQWSAYKAGTWHPRPQPNAEPIPMVRQRRTG